jgi:hypothetical protein
VKRERGEGDNKSFAGPFQPAGTLLQSSSSGTVYADDAGANNRAAVEERSPRVFEEKTNSGGEQPASAKTKPAVEPASAKTKPAVEPASAKTKPAVEPASAKTELAVAAVNAPMMCQPPKVAPPAVKAETAVKVAAPVGRCTLNQVDP